MDTAGHKSVSEAPRDGSGSPSLRYLLLSVPSPSSTSVIKTVGKQGKVVMDVSANVLGVTSTRPTRRWLNRPIKTADQVVEDMLALTSCRRLPETPPRLPLTLVPPLLALTTAPPPLLTPTTTRPTTTTTTAPPPRPPRPGHIEYPLARLPNAKFHLSLKFDDAGLTPVSISSSEADEEESRCQHALNVITKTLASLERERVQIELGVRRLDDELARLDREQRWTEDRLKLLEGQRSDLRARIAETSDEKKRCDDVGRSRFADRCQAEFRLRESQLTVCRKKLELSRNFESQDFKSQELKKVLAQELMDEDQKVQDQQNQLVKLHQVVSRVQEECEAAEKVLASLNHDAAAVADQMQRLHHDVERNKQLYRETTASKQTSTARLSAIDDQRRLHKRHRLEIAQMLILIDTCRRIRNVNQTIET